MSRALKLIAGFVVIMGCAAAGVFGANALFFDDNSASQDGRGGAQATRVGVASPEMRRVEDTVSAVGTLRPVRSVELVPDAPGRVTQVPVVSGEEVSAGQVLVQLDNRAAKAAVAEAEATLDEARGDLQRVQELADSNTAAEARLEAVRATFRRAEAAVMMAKANLEDRAIRAPFAGVLGLIDVEPGAFLDGSVPVTRLSDLSSVEVEISLPERYFASVTSDQALFVTTPAYPDETFEARITVRAPEIDGGTRSFDVRARIDNPDGRLVGGMFANSRLVLDRYDALAIPDDAIISEGLDTYVYTVENETAKRMEIEPGLSLGGLTEVREGLAEESRIVVSGWDRLSDGAPVEIAEDVARQGLE